MNKAEELKTITGLVKSILEANVQARNSDGLLYLKVLERFAEQKRMDIHRLTVPTLLLCGKELGLPGFETVRRSRQKIQAEYPELSGNEKVEAYRAANEAAFKNYAKGAV
jgi:hypothetical protein